jgi:hypothetical protein
MIHAPTRLAASKATRETVSHRRSLTIRSGSVSGVGKGAPESSPQSSISGLESLGTVISTPKTWVCATSRLNRNEMTGGLVHLQMWAAGGTGSGRPEEMLWGKVGSEPWRFSFLQAETLLLPSTSTVSRCQQ